MLAYFIFTTSKCELASGHFISAVAPQYYNSFIAEICRVLALLKVI